MSRPSSSPEQRHKRFRLALAWLRTRGVSQQQIALQTGVGAAYVSDIKAGRRALSELFARRLADKFDVDSDWILTGKKSSFGYRLGLRLGRRGLGSLHGLPVLSEPIGGDPRSSPLWDGSTVELTSRAAQSAAERAVNPYVLRLGHADHAGRLQINDLILVSQAAAPDAQFVVVVVGDRLRLARLRDSGELRDVETGKRLPSKAPVVGHCIAIIWSPL